MIKKLLCFILKGHFYIWESESDFFGQYWTLNYFGVCKHCGHKKKKKQKFGER